GRWKVVTPPPLAPREPARDVTFEPGRLIPFAIHAWDGANGERGLMMALSSWAYVVPEAPVSAWAYLSSLLALCVGHKGGRNGRRPKGDERGEVRSSRPLLSRLRLGLLARRHVSRRPRH